MTIKLRITRKKLLLGLPLLALAAGAAYAAWTLSITSQSGRSQVATLGNPTTANPATFTGVSLVPGGSGDFQISITNPNSVPLQVTGYTGDSTPSDWTTSNPGSCGAGLFSGPIMSATPTALTPAITIAANATATVTLPNAVSLAASAPVGCEGVAFTHTGSGSFTLNFST